MMMVWTDAAEAGILERIEEDSVNDPNLREVLNGVLIAFRLT
jgi:hypothetical protein